MQTLPGQRHCAASDLVFTESLYRRINISSSFARDVRDTEFLSMLSSYRRSGGLAQSQEMASILARRSASIGTLARWVVEGEAIHLQWQDETWFPVFQFVGADLSPSAGVSRVLMELRGVLDPWDMAHWFACPFSTLSGRIPADAMRSDADLVLYAARRDRYVIDA